MPICLLPFRNAFIHSKLTHLAHNKCDKYLDFCWAYLSIHLLNLDSKKLHNFEDAIRSK